MSEWKRYKLGELLRVKHGWAFKGEFFSDTGIQSILTPGNFYESGGFKANPSKDRFYCGDYPKEYLCSKGDLIVVMTEQAAGLLGSTAIVPEDNRYLHNQRIGLISCNESLNKDFAYYLFMTQSVRQQISRSASGTKVKHTSPEKIYDVQVDIPKIQTQKNIAIFLSSLDKKIQINNQIHQELEAMAKTLYDYWFVQFDFPDQNGKPYKSSGGKMVYHPELKREIPEGWEVEKLGELIELERGVTYAKSDIVEKTTKDAIGVLRATNITGNVMDLNDLVYLTKDKINNKQIIKQNETLIVMSSGSKEHLGKNAINYYEEVIGFGAFCSKIVPQKYSAFINTFLQSPEFKGYLLKQSMGTNIINLTNSDILDCRIILPKEEILDKFENMVEKNIRLISNNYIQNQELTQLRDWLLPMLMNGQVKVE